MCQGRLPPGSWLFTPSLQLSFIALILHSFSSSHIHLFNLSLLNSITPSLLCFFTHHSLLQSFILSFLHSFTSSLNNSITPTMLQYLLCHSFTSSLHPLTSSHHHYFTTLLFTSLLVPFNRSSLRLLHHLISSHIHRLLTFSMPRLLLWTSSLYHSFTICPLIFFTILF